jgi:MoxR-like ATPase
MNFVNQTPTSTGLEHSIAVANKLREALCGVVRGRDDTITAVLVGLLGEGHVLLEDYPGSGKTTLAKTLGGLIDSRSSSGVASGSLAPFRRIQFTPDLLPGDVLGVNVFEPKTGEFRFLAGPVFAHIVLADEINRAGPKVQSAFLECMAERQVTIDNVTHPLDELFFVIGTQNPLDIAGTYPLPVVQLDRFMVKAPMPYVDSATERSILSEQHEITARATAPKAVVTREDVIAARRTVREVTVSDKLRDAIVELVQATRKSGQVLYPASTRAALMLQSAVRAHAVIAGRSAATEDDLKAMIAPVLLHRMKLSPGVNDPKKALMEIAMPAMERLIRAM